MSLHALLRVVVISGALALAWAVPSPATVMEALDVEQLAGLADAVVHIRTESVRVHWSDSGIPVTIAELLVIEAVRGDVGPRQRLTVSQPGGARDGVALEYAGRPVFVAGTESVIFLRRRQPGHYIPVALAQGKFDVGPRGAAGRRPVRRRLEGIRFQGNAAPHFPSTLGALKSQVRALPRELAGGTR